MDRNKILQDYIEWYKETNKETEEEQMMKHIEEENKQLRLSNRKKLYCYACSKVKEYSIHYTRNVCVPCYNKMK